MLDWAGWGQTKKDTLSLCVAGSGTKSAGAVGSSRLTGHLLPLLRSKDRPLLNVFLSLHPAIQIPLQVYDGFAEYLSNFYVASLNFAGSCGELIIIYVNWIRSYFIRSERFIPFHYLNYTFYISIFYSSVISTSSSNSSSILSA